MYRYKETHSALWNAPPFMHMQDKQKSRRTAKQTGRQAKQTGKQDDAACARVRQTDRQTGKQDTLVNSKNKARTNSKTKNKHANQTQTDRHTDGQRDRQRRQTATDGDWPTSKLDALWLLCKNLEPTAPRHHRAKSKGPKPKRTQQDMQPTNHMRFSTKQKARARNIEKNNPFPEKTQQQQTSLINKFPKQVTQKVFGGVD